MECFELEWEKFHLLQNLNLNEDQELEERWKKKLELMLHMNLRNTGRFYLCSSEAKLFFKLINLSNAFMYTVF